MYLFIFLFLFQSLYATPLAKQFAQNGFVEIYINTHGAETFDSLYVTFDELTEFLQKNPAFAQKLYIAKEGFIRTKERSFYSADFFGFYDDSKKPERSQISFYYSSHFHEYIASHYPLLLKNAEISNFFDACQQIQEPYKEVFQQALTSLVTLPSSDTLQSSLLLKVIKYLPYYVAGRPHYDGGLLSLFLDSTDNDSLLLSPYKPSFTIDDFSPPARAFSRKNNQNSALLIPGVLLTEFSIYPTPHIVTESGRVRYATVAFAMKPHYTPKKISLSSLPNFKIE